MLIKLGKWLRVAGYDAKIVKTSLADRQILQMAIEEKRHLITRDNHFLQFKEGKEFLIFLKSNDFEDCIREFTKISQINWLHAPFSRCLLCNEPLHTIPSEKAKRENIPEKIFSDYTAFWQCPKCKKVFWLGSHTEQMKSKLTNWGKIQ